MENGNSSVCNSSYTVLVNSCDAFEDCWGPFFILLNRYWPTLIAPILLNTETKEWKFDGINLKCTKVQLGENVRLSWSECLLSALDQVETPFVLYFQEDYFINSPVNADLVEKAVDYLIDHPDVQRIALTHYNGPGPFENYPEDWLRKVSKNAKYRISTQASLWRVDNLKSYLNKIENGWMFEIFGTWRASRRNDIFLIASDVNNPTKPAIDYLHTGIIKGQWHIGMKKVFSDNAIAMDFTKRGFHIPQKGMRRKIAVIKKLLENRAHAVKQMYARIKFY